MGQVVERLGFGEPRPGRAEAVAETLAALHGTGEGPEELAHDARNMVTALELYCELLDEPGVLAPRYRHYGSELRLVVAASRRLVDKLAAFESPESLQRGWTPRGRGPVRGEAHAPGRLDSHHGLDGLPEAPIADLAAELEAKRNLLVALAGPAVALEMCIQGGAQSVWLTREDLTRVLVNLVKNALEAMRDGGRIRIGLDEFHAPSRSSWLVLTVEDSGPGIAGTALEQIFAAGFTTHSGSGSGLLWRRGLGLSITRSIVEGAGGRVFAANRRGGGARFEIELPVRTP
jgi:signal transduction histidine kinase